MKKKLGPKGKSVIKVLIATTISIVSVVADRALPTGLDELIISLFNL